MADYSVDGSSGFTTLTEAVGTVGSTTDCALHVYTNQTVSGSDLVVTSNITLIIHAGAVITVTDVTMCINGPLVAGMYKIFEYSGTGQVLFGAGAEMVSNGGFSSDTVWSHDTGWTITGGKANHVIGNTSDLTQSITPAVGRSYLARFTTSNYVNSGTVPSVPDYMKVYVGSDSVNIANDGTFTILFHATSANGLVFHPQSPLAMSIDNVSIRQYYPSLTSVYYPQWWGAKGDGTTDSTAAMQAAVDAVGFSGGGIVKVLPGTYVLSTRVNIRENVNFHGLGTTTKLIPAANFPATLATGYGLLGMAVDTSTANFVWLIEGFAIDTTPCSNAICGIWLNKEGWRLGIRDLEIVGATNHVGIDVPEQSYNSSGTAARHANRNHSVFEAITFIGHQTSKGSFYVQVNDDVENVFVKNCQFYTDSPQMVFGGLGCTIEGCYFNTPSGSPLNGSVNSGGLYPRILLTASSGANVIRDCYFEGGYDVYIWGNYYPNATSLSSIYLLEGRSIYDYDYNVLNTVQNPLTSITREGASQWSVASNITGNPNYYDVGSVHWVQSANGLKRYTASIVNWDGAKTTVTTGTDVLDAAPLSYVYRQLDINKLGNRPGWDKNYFTEVDTRTLQVGDEWVGTSIAQIRREGHSATWTIPAGAAGLPGRNSHEFTLNSPVSGLYSFVQASFPRGNPGQTGCIIENCYLNTAGTTVTITIANWNQTTPWVLDGEVFNIFIIQ